MILCVLFIWAGPPLRGSEGIDHAVYRKTVERMRDGDGYYEAMDQSLREVYGPAETLRAYRTPPVFVLWRWLPSPAAIWWTLAALIALTVALLAPGTNAPLVLPVVAMYLLTTARVPDAAGWTDQFLLVELWTVPLVALAVWATERGRPPVAAAAGLLAAAVRELAVPLLAGGLWATWRTRRARGWWLAAAVAVAGLGIAHVVAVSGHLVADGAETSLTQEQVFPASVFRIAGFGLPGGAWAGAVVWPLALLALARGWRTPRARLLAPYFALPLAGLVVNRPYWGALVVPFALLLVAEQIADLLAKRRAAVVSLRA